MKKAKPSTSFDSPEEFQIAIVDRSNPDGKMMLFRWMEVETRLLLAIAGLKDDSSGEWVAFEEAVLQSRVKFVGCSSRRSTDFLVGGVEGCGEQIRSNPYFEAANKEDHLRMDPPPVLKNEKLIDILK